MTPQRWKGAGVILMVIAVLLIVAAVVSVISVPAGPVAFELYPPTGTGLFAASELRAVVLGAFAGVAFFLSLACFIWSGIAEAAQQRAEILIELTALRARADKAAGTEQSGS